MAWSLDPYPGRRKGVGLFQPTPKMLAMCLIFTKANFYKEQLVLKRISHFIEGRENYICLKKEKLKVK